MKNLFIDTSSLYVYVAIIDDKKILASFNDKLDNDMSSKIFPIIDDLFSKVPFSINDIDKVYVVNGPGSFTGVRIGVTIAKVFASMLNKEVCPISSLELMASGSNNSCLALIDARRGFVYAGAYDNNLNCLLNDSYINLNDIDINKYDNIVSYDSFSFNVSKPSYDIIKLINKYENNTVIPHSLKPNYLKKTEAEEKLSDKND